MKKDPMMEATLERPSQVIGTHHPVPKLSSYNISVLQWLADGKQIGDIAVIMEAEETAVRQRISRIKDKLGANTLAGAVTIALRAGLIK